MFDRRMFLGGAGVTIGFPGAISMALQPSPAPTMFVGTPLESNPLARGFTTVDQALPSVKLATASGMVDLARLTGKTRIVTLWAEWCVPCLLEAKDFAALAKRYAGPDFEIVSILTGSIAKLDHVAGIARLVKAGADGLPLLVEPGGGRQVLERLSPGATGHGTLPCTLLVDRRGRVRGRSGGAPVAGGVRRIPGGGAIIERGIDGKPAPMILDEAQKRALLGSGTHTLWGSPAGDSLVAALRDGALK